MIPVLKRAVWKLEQEFRVWFPEKQAKFRGNASTHAKGTGAQVTTKTVASNTISWASLFVSLATFLVLYVPIQDIHYTVATLNVQNLVNLSGLADTGIELHLTLVNGGNKPAVIVLVEMFMMNSPRTWKPSDLEDGDCDRTGNPNWQPIHLYEKETQPSNVRGDDTDASYGNRVIAPINLPAYSIADIKHRFSLFNQLNGFPSSISGILCLDVAAMTVSGRVYHAPQSLGLLRAQRGQTLRRVTSSVVGDNQFYRLNGTKIPPRNTGPIYPIIPHNQPAPQAPTKALLRNWMWFL